ncbi:MAG: enolase C-terminal domain-like protein [Rhodoglobus sp.]
MSIPTIARIDAYPLPYRETNDNDSTRYSCLVRVEDAAGTVGWGEAATIVREAASATAVLVRGFASALAGTPASPEAASATMAAHAWWHGGAGIASFAVSAIDMALWDLVGRREGTNLSVLLGAASDASLDTIITCHASVEDLGEMTAEMAEWVAHRGASGIKIAFGKTGASRLGVELERDIAFMTALRRALGDDTPIMIDVGPRVGWNVEQAQARIDSLAPLGLAWLEEPLGARNPQGYRQLHENARGVLIAYGEREWNVTGVQEILSTGTVDVVGMDPGRIDGVSGFRAAATLCAAAGVKANAHAFAGPLVYASSLALSLASEACSEFELAPTRNELYDFAGAPELHSSVGRLSALTEPGLGIAVDGDRVRAASAASGL